PKPNNAIRGDDDNLALSGECHEHWGNVSLPVAERAPNRRTGDLVIGYHGFPRRSAGKHYDFVVHNQRRGGQAPLKVLSAVVLEDVLGPVLFSGFGFKTEEVALGTQNIQAARVPGWCRPRTIPAH